MDVNTEKQIEHFAYDKDGKFVGVYVATPAQFAESGFTAGKQPPAPKPPVPQTISFAQLLTALVTGGLITEAEGDAWLSGQALPKVAADLVAAMPAAEQFGARARLLRMVEANRQSPLVAALAKAAGLTGAQVDALFTKAAAL